MPHANGAEASKTVGFLDLSRELRDQIYRELLFQPIGYGAARRRHKFETSILRVNKQIHKEASRVLYEENAWVVFESRSPGGSILDLPSERYPITISRNISRNGRLAFGGNPSLRVRVQFCQNRFFEILHYVIIPLEWVRDMTRVFVRGDISYHPEYLEDDEFAVHFHQNQKHESRQKMAMEFLEIIRGVRKAKIYGLTSPSLGASLAKHMMTPIKSIDELIDRTSVFIRRAELMFAQDQLHLAEELYNQGYDSSTWAAATDRTFMTNVSPRKSRILRSKLCESLEGSAVCSLRHGNSRPACTKLMEYILDNSDLPDSQKARGFHYYGLAMVAAGNDRRALFGFMRVLILIPGHEAVDNEVDALEERVKKGMSTEDVWALIPTNAVPKDFERYWTCGSLDLVKPCRHKNASDGKLPQLQTDKMILDFWR